MNHPVGATSSRGDRGAEMPLLRAPPVARAIRSVFLALVVTQAAHSVEEYTFGFTERFAPARFLDQVVPGIARPGFITLNLAFVGFGMWCFVYRVLPERSDARTFVWVWVAIELYNGLAHAAWAFATGSYNPGLLTAPLLFLEALGLLLLMRRG